MQRMKVICDTCFTPTPWLDSKNGDESYVHTSCWKLFIDNFNPSSGYGSAYELCSLKCATEILISILSENPDLQVRLLKTTWSWRRDSADI